MTPEPTLAQKLADPDESERAFAAQDAGDDGAAACIAPLVSRLAVESSQVVRETIICALLKLPHPEVTAQAVLMLDSEEAHVRAAAVRLLKARIPEVLDLIPEVLRAADADVRKLIVDVLGTSVHARATALLVGCLADADGNVQIAAIEALGDRKAREALPFIARTIESSSEPMLLAAALVALEAIGEPSSYTWVEQRFPALSTAPELQVPVMQIAARFGPPSIAALLIERAAELARSFPVEAVDAVETFYARFGELPVPREARAHLATLVRGAGKAGVGRLARWIEGEAKGGVPTP